MLRTAPPLSRMTRTGTSFTRSTATARLPASARWRSSRPTSTCGTRRPPEARASSAAAGGRAVRASFSGALTADRPVALVVVDPSLN